MEKQLTNRILMIRPAHFGFNNETAETNRFQSNDHSIERVDEKAKEEFDGMVEILRNNGVEVIVFEDLRNLVLPDAVFPNNWFSTHDGNIIFTYPMFAPVRRLERREDILNFLEKQQNYVKRYSLEILEEEGKYLEGTGSMVLDREHKLAYACLSPRTDIRALDTFSMLSHYKIVYFNASDKNGSPIYHTNVLMAIGHDFVVCCMEAIQANQREIIADLFATTGKELVDISFDQMGKFAGNMLELTNAGNDKLLVLSQTAYESLNSEQKATLERHAKLLSIPIPTIEKIGGGSTRCMIAELF
ncbi:MAG: amidinotransferase [Saprospiraceae bacterium]|nr:amidinotransferase [Saprospiraceae bacterium]